MQNGAGTAAQENSASNQPDDMAWNINPGGQWRPGETDGIAEYVCKTCGGTITGDYNLAATSCPPRGSLTSPSYLVRNCTLGPPLESNPEIPPSSRAEGLRLLHGLETNLATCLQTPQEA